MLDVLTGNAHTLFTLEGALPPPGDDAHAKIRKYEITERSEL